MDLPALIQALSAPAAFPFPVKDVVIHQTHISVVFLAGDFAYKVKKPVRLPFLDFSTLEGRRFFCQEEVRLNRRLAPDVYLDVVPIAQQGDNLRWEAQGDVVEWAVKMRRLAEQDTLEHLVTAGAVDAQDLRSLAELLARFHAHADPAPEKFGGFDMIAANARDNLAQAAGQVGETLSDEVQRRLHRLIEDHLERLRPLIERRAREGRTRDTHGDLRLEHVYRHGADWIIVDCIEFNDRFRFADPVADLAFLIMDLSYGGRRDLGRALSAAYCHAAGDDQGRELLPFYSAYRAAVRGKVEAMQLAEPEIPADQRAHALASARAHWLLALGELETPDQRPCLLLVGGLPGTGKSTLARRLAERSGFVVLRSDAVRKELAGVAQVEDLYSPAWTDRTYAEVQRRAEGLLFQGRRVLIDANFALEKQRQAFLQAARAWGVPGLLLVCQASEDTIRRRLAARQGDVSDADWQVYLRQRGRWQNLAPATAAQTHLVSLEGSPEDGWSEATEVLRREGLM